MEKTEWENEENEAGRKKLQILVLNPFLVEMHKKEIVIILL